MKNHPKEKAQPNHKQRGAHLKKYYVFSVRERFFHKNLMYFGVDTIDGYKILRKSRILNPQCFPEVKKRGQINHSKEMSFNKLFLGTVNDISFTNECIVGDGYESKSNAIKLSKLMSTLEETRIKFGENLITSWSKADPNNSVKKIDISSCMQEYLIANAINTLISITKNKNCTFPLSEECIVMESKQPPEGREEIYAILYLVCLWYQNQIHFIFQYLDNIVPMCITKHEQKTSIKVQCRNVKQQKMLQNCTLYSLFESKYQEFYLTYHFAICTYFQGFTKLPIQVYFNEKINQVKIQHLINVILHIVIETKGNDFRQIYLFTKNSPLKGYLKIVQLKKEYDRNNEFLSCLQYY